MGELELVVVMLNGDRLAVVGDGLEELKELDEPETSSSNETAFLAHVVANRTHDMKDVMVTRAAIAYYGFQKRAS